MTGRRAGGALAVVGSVVFIAYMLVRIWGVLHG